MWHPQGWEPMKLPYKELPGFSKNLLADHYKLYTGYIKRLKKVYELVDQLPDKPDRNEFQRLVLEEGFLVNAIRLHELYFGQLTPKGAGEAGDILGELTDDYLEDLTLAAMGSTGWAILAVDIAHAVPGVFTMKDHSQGYVAESWPILVVDAYEHAYMREYGLDKEAYLQSFFVNVDWNVVAERTKQGLAMAEIAASEARVR